MDISLDDAINTLEVRKRCAEYTWLEHCPTPQGMIGKCNAKCRTIGTCVMEYQHSITVPTKAGVNFSSNFACNFPIRLNPVQ